MKSDKIEITTGENSHQSADFEPNDRTIDYETSKNLSYADIISINRALNIVSEFYDVKAVVSSTPSGLCAAALGENLDDALIKVMDSNPIDYMSSTIALTDKVDSNIARLIKDSHIVAAPDFTENAVEYLENHDICFVKIITPLKDYKKYLSDKIVQTPLGTLTESPNLAELNKDMFKVVTKNKPSVEQVEDAVFAWKVAKHCSSRAIVIAKNFKTAAISQGLQASSIEYTLDYSCDASKEAILACDMGITVHDLNVAAQGRISVIILPFASKDIIAVADKYQMAVITTGITNILY